MRKKLIVAGAIAGVLLVGGIVASFVLEGRVLALLEEEVNRDLNATVAFGDADVSVLAGFPSIGLRVRDLTVTGKGNFEGITLASVDELRLDLDPWSLLGGGPVEIEGLSLRAPVFHVVIDEEERANYDIWPESEPSDDAGGAPYHYRLQRLRIADGAFVYEDRAGDVHASLSGLDLDARGDLTQDVLSMETHAEVGHLNARYGSLPLLSDIPAAVDGTFDYGMADGAITLGEMRIGLAALALGLSGTVLPTEAGYEVDLSYQTLDTAFKTLLSLLPSAYTEGFADVDATGTLALAGTAKGLYASEADHLPAFDLALEVTGARVQYPDLPSAVEGIEADIAVRHPEGPTDLAEIDVRTFQFSVGGNPVQGSLQVRHPSTDPDLAAKVGGRLDLTSLANAWPLQDTTLAGRVDLDVDVAGRMSDFEARAVDKIDAAGGVSLTDVRYEGPSLAVPVLVETLAVDLTPRSAVVKALRAKLGSSDVAGEGRIDNLLPYLVSDATLAGTFDLHGDLLDLEAFAGGEEAPSEGEAPGALVAVPANLDLAVGSRFGEVRFNGLVFENVHGTLRVRDGALRMEGLELDLIGGHATLDGTYAAPTADAADIDLQIDAVRFDVPRVMETFTSLQRIAPVAKGATGRFDSAMKLTAKLNRDGTPDLSALASDGRIRTYDVRMAPGALAQVAEQLLDPKYRSLQLNATTLLYVLAQGKLQIDPTAVTLGGVPAKLHGGVGVLERTLDLDLDLRVPTATLKGAPFLAAAPAALGQQVDVRARLTGPWDSPKVAVGLGGGGVAEQARQAVGQVVGGAADDLVASASAEGDRLIAAAETQAARVRSEAAKAAGKVRSEAKAAGAQLIAEAGNNPIAVAAARQAAKRLEAEADEKARRLETEADSKATGLVQAAEAEKERLIAEAQKRSR